MAQIRLKKIVNNKKTKTILQGLIVQLNEEVAISDEKGKWLLGTASANAESSHNIEFEGKLIGKIFGSEKTKPIADLIHFLIIREHERKKLGTEVLNLYREVNVMYSFTEKLAETINQEDIAKLTLAEIKNSIKASKGFITLNETASKYSLIDEFNFSEIRTAVSENNFYKEIIEKKEAGIIDNYQISSSKNVSIIFTPLKVKEHFLGMLLLVAENQYQFTAADLKLLSTLSTQSAAAIESAQLYEKNIKEAREKEAAIRALHEVTRRFVPNEFIKFLGYDQITEVALGDSVEKEVTVFFSDIRGYTSLSEQMTPAETFRFVNAFNNRMGPIIQKNNGFINQYLGDGIMAIFPHNPSDALNAAIEMHKELQLYNKVRSTKNRQPIKIGIGLHTGPLIMGITGDQERLDATTIADTVNTAARLESLTKYYGVNILLSGSSFSKIYPITNQEHLNNPLRYLGKVQVKGKNKAIKIYESFGGDLSDMVKAKKETKNNFNTAVYNLQELDFNAAHHSLLEIVDKNPNDKTALYFLNKAKQLLQKGNNSEWTGVELMTKK